jgi:hypothetical protein
MFFINYLLKKKLIYFWIILTLLCSPHTLVTSTTGGNNQFYATCQEITPDILAKMIYTCTDDSPVALKDLRYPLIIL